LILIERHPGSFFQTSKDSPIGTEGASVNLRRLEVELEHFSGGREVEYDTPVFLSEIRDRIATC